MKRLLSILIITLAMFCTAYLWAEDGDEIEESSVVEDNESLENTSEAESVDEEGEPPVILHIDHLIAAAWDPLGVKYTLDVYLRSDFFPNSDNMLISGAHLSYGIREEISPAYNCVGPFIQIAPLTIFILDVQLAKIYSGLLGDKYGILDYSSEGQFGDYSYSYRGDNAESMGSTSNDVWALFVRPTILLKVWKIILIDQMNFMFYNNTNSNFSGLYYNFIADMILAESSWVLFNDMMLVYDFFEPRPDGMELRAGLSLRFTHLLDHRHHDNLEKAYTGKIGAIVAWTITDQWLDYRFEKPSIIAGIHYYINDPIADDDAKRMFYCMLVYKMSTNWSVSRD